MERQNFEDGFKQAFEQAELNPPDNVWNSVEFELARTEADQMKRRLMFYKMVAAASIIFALAAVGMNLYLLRNNPFTSTPTVATVSENSNATEAINEAVADDQIVDTNRGTEEQIAGTTESNSAAWPAPSETPVEIATEDVALADKYTSRFFAADHTGKDITSVMPLRKNDFNKRMQTGPVIMPKHGSDITEDPVVAMMQRLEKREQDLRAENEKETASENVEKLWTSVGFAAGPFSSVSESHAAVNRTLDAEAFVKSTSA
ncbi:MAG TPA: hypothetical protein VEB86_09345, partial [Chryseosolibacter sp.]|nr:hypothetical protein [Chryseosolibacter sp.]